MSSLHADLSLSLPVCPSWIFNFTGRCRQKWKHLSFLHAWRFAWYTRKWSLFYVHSEFAHFTFSSWRLITLITWALSCCWVAEFVANDIIESRKVTKDLWSGNWVLQCWYIDCTCFVSMSVLRFHFTVWLIWNFLTSFCYTFWRNVKMSKTWQCDKISYFQFEKVRMVHDVARYQFWCFVCVHCTLYST